MLGDWALKIRNIKQRIDNGIVQLVWNTVAWEKSVPIELNLNVWPYMRVGEGRGQTQAHKHGLLDYQGISSLAWNIMNNIICRAILFIWLISIIWNECSIECAIDFASYNTVSWTQNKSMQSECVFVVANLATRSRQWRRANVSTCKVISKTEWRVIHLSDNAHWEGEKGKG